MLNTTVVGDVLYVVGGFVLLYYVVLNSSYVGLLSLAAVDLRTRLRREALSGSCHDDVFTNPLTPGVSILLPAHGRGAVVAESARTLLDQRYPDFELIVIDDDDSTDDTFARLADDFALVEVPVAVADDLQLEGQITGVHRAPDGVPLTVIRKHRAERVGDARNAGLLLATKPLVCMIDPDSVLESGALLRVVAPFVDDPRHMIAVNSAVRPRNGSELDRGRIASRRMPQGWLARMQVVEHMRAFLVARFGWGRLRGLPIVSGSFGMYRRDLLLKLGGVRTDAIGQDLELMLRIIRHVYRRGRGDRIGFVADPVCWTRVPDTWRSLARQRTRWSRGLARALWAHRGAIANPRYGRVGMLLMPSLVVFKLLGPLVEVAGVLAIALGLGFGLVSVPFAWLLLTVAVAFPLLVSLGSLALEDFTLQRFARGRDLVQFVAAALLEPFGFRQAHALWHLSGLLSGLRGTRTSPVRATSVKRSKRSKPSKHDDGSDLSEVAAPLRQVLATARR